MLSCKPGGGGGVGGGGGGGGKLRCWFHGVVENEYFW